VVVYTPEHAGHLRLLANSRASLQLVRELETAGRLGVAAIERVMDALRDFRALAVGAGAARIVAIATAAVREAEDGDRLVERIQSELGVEVQILDSESEAHYGFLGAVRGVPVDAGTLFDLGGGSLQITRFDRRGEGSSWGFPLGALRVSNRFLTDDPPTRAEIKRLRDHVREVLGEVATPLGPGERLIGTGGTVRNLARLDRAARAYPISRIHGYALRRRDLRNVVSELVKRRLKRKGRMPGLSRNRGDSIVGGGLVVATLMEVLGASEVVVSGQGVREGVVYSLAGDGLPSIGQVRESTLAALAWRFRTWDADAASRRAGIAEALVDGLDPGAHPEFHDALIQAAMMLDIGCSVDFFNRHEHAADIVAATELDGFSHREVALLSAILRRTGDEDAGLEPYRPLLSAADAAAVERAAVLVGLADEIEERCPRGTAIGVECRLRRNEAIVSVPLLAGWRSQDTGERFETAFGRRLLVSRRAMREFRRS
jgi:exopolyphosphatase/guanosine-5'-triphosphate,3'-diphosphate pyrophosphatase